MAAVLDVWIARPGDACLVDDDEWIVEVDDSGGSVFTWAGTTYANLDAPNAHWAGAIPPGCYVVHAVNARTGVRTDHAIVSVDCSGTSCVHLFVGGGQAPPDCKVKIQQVLGIGQSVANSIQVAGTAANCTSIKVSVTCQTGQTSTSVASVTGGVWTVTVGVQNLRCLCGKPVKVTAQCVQHPECKDEFQSEALKCSAEPSS